MDYYALFFAAIVGTVCLWMITFLRRSRVHFFHLEPLVFTDFDFDFDFDAADREIDALNDIGAGIGGGPAHDDRQNVHDTSIQAHIREAVQCLSEKQTAAQISTPNTVGQIRHFIMDGSSLSDDVRERALSALRLIVKQNGIIVSIGKNELDVLKLVWNRIMHPVNEQQRKTLQDNLVLQLSDSMQTDSIAYCIQGRVTRIIQSLEHADAEAIVNLKPLWAIKEEIATFFSNYQQKFIARLKPSVQRVYNQVIDPSPIETALINRINKKLSTGIRKRLFRKYVEHGLLSQKQFDDVTAPYLNVLSVN